MNEGGQPVLSLLAPPGTDMLALDGIWRIAFSDPADPDGRAYTLPEFDDSSWEQVHLPHLKYSTAERDVLWYRHHFRLTSLPHSPHTLLRFGGAFYDTSVWLNGVSLGTHEGYFQPFGFEVGSLLRAGENVVAVRCHFPVEAGAFKRKTAVAGIFADWDCKPYPSTYYPHLPAPYEWTVPLGLWQTACLQPLGSLLVETFAVFAEPLNPRWTAGADAAHVRIILKLRVLSTSERAARARVEIAPHNFAGELVARGDWEIARMGETSRRVEFTLTVPEPRLWFPWTHGTPHLYRATLAFDSGDGAICELVQIFGIRSIRAVIGEQCWEWSLNGRRIFPKGSNYVSDFFLDRVSVEGLGRDLALARGANLDLLRVHAHIGAPDFYRLCDEQGLLVICDFPLIWTYASKLPAGEQEAFRMGVQTQVEDMVDLLGSHPSIILWSMHNEPPWTPDGSFLGADVHTMETNRLNDEAAAERVRALDSTRPTIAASGQYDQHLYHGWYTGAWRDNRDLQPVFPTEFGVQALPNLNSPFWGTVNTTWPVELEDPTWAHAGYQSVFWVHPGVGAPSHYPTLAEYVSESQSYQAFYIRYTIDQWRRQKFAPVGGYVHFLLTDGWPAISWSVLDYFREPKCGFRALAEASNPAHVCIDLADGYQVEGAFHLVFAAGAVFKADLYLVNDDYRLQGRARVHWWLEPRKAGPVRRRLARWFAAHITVDLPRADDGARLIRSVSLPLRDTGLFTFRVRVTLAGRVLDESYYDLQVGERKKRHSVPRRVPGFLVGRVYEYGSLRHTADGATFRLHNPAMPVLLERLVTLRVDGKLIDPAQVDLIRGGQSRRASSITPEACLEVLSGEHLAVVLREHHLSLGEHELEATGQIFGLGEITARWHDRMV